MCYVHNQWYDISYVILCIVFAVMKQRPEELAGVYLRCFAVQKLLAKSDRRPRRIIPLDNECAYFPLPPPPTVYVNVKLSKMFL